MSSEQKLPQFLTLDRAAEVLTVCRRTVERLISAGHLRAVKIGWSTRIDLAELLRYIESHRSGGPSSS